MTDMKENLELENQYIEKRVGEILRNIKLGQKYDVVVKCDGDDFIKTIEYHVTEAVVPIDFAKRIEVMR